jgi:arylformamidase
MRAMGFRAAGIIAVALLQAGPSAAATGEPGASVHRDLRYVFTPREGVPARQQSLDLFLPADAGKSKPPLIAFVHGGFWRESDDGYGIGNAVAQALIARGAAVALLRYPLAPAHKFPAQPEDIARAVTYLHRVADHYGYDPRRIFLMGHSAGAHLASLVALDGRYLRAAKAPDRAIAGVIAVSGIYDLGLRGPIAPRADELVEPVFGKDARVHAVASPLAHARGGPPFLVLSGENDFNGFPADARRFAARLRAGGNRNVQEIVMQGFDHFTFFRNLHASRSVMRDLVLAFAGIGKPDAFHAELWQARRLWQEPPLSTEPFWAKPELVKAYPVDERFLAVLGLTYDQGSLFELSRYPLREFHAIELARFLGSRPRKSLGSGEHMVLTNARGEKVFWRLKDIEPYQPVVVVGLDDERNLFRLSAFYHNKRAYSWTEETTALSVRSMGAFIHFLKPPPPRFEASTTAIISLTVDGFRLVQEDPLAAMADLPRDVHDAMSFRNGCFSCHSFRGTDVRAGHIRARDGKRQGGYALALESYPPEVWRQFMHDNAKSAAAIGVRPNPVTGPAAEKLFDIVVKERGRKSRAAGP